MADVQTEQSENPASAPPAPKPRRKAKRRAGPGRAKPAAPFKAPDEFSGMTETECCDVCADTGTCVISGVQVCAHPFKGGLQAALAGDPKVLARYERARRALRHRKLDLSTGDF